MATASSPAALHVNANGLPPQFPSGEAAVTHIKRFCFASSRRTCRLERAKSGGNCKLLICASNSITTTTTSSSSSSNNVKTTNSPSNGNGECPWFVRVNRSRKPNERGWRVKDANLQHSERCLSAASTSNCVPDTRTIAHALVTGSSSAGIKSISTISDRRDIGSSITATIQAGSTRTGANGGNMMDAETPARVLREHIKSALDVDVKKRTLYRLKSKLLRIQDELSSRNSSVYSAAGSSSSGFVTGTIFYGLNSTSIATDRYVKSYQWIESLLRQFCELNPGSVAELQVDANNRFQRAIVVPKHFTDAVVNCQQPQSKTSPLQRVVSIQMQPLVECTKGGFAGVQVNLAARDGNCQEFVVATAIFRDEDAANFQWMLERLKATGVDFAGSGGSGEDKPLLVFCDRSPDSSFLRAIQEMNPSSSLSNLLFTPGDIFRYMLSEKLVSEVEKVYVLQAQAAQRIEDFRAVVDSLRVYRPQAASFLESLDSRIWAMYANLDRRLYGWIGASSFSSGGDHQSQDGSRPHNPFECLYESMNAMMKGLFERSENARKWSEVSNRIDNSVMHITPAAQRLLNQELSVIEDYDVRPCNPELVYVRHVSKAAEHRTRKVNFTAKTCTCAFYQQIGVPCRHIGAALKFACKMERVYEFVDSCYTVSSYAEAFGGKFIQIPLEEDLKLNLTHMPPDSSTVSPGGDRSNKRKAQGQSTRSYKCSNCGSAGGHNKKTCPLVAPQ